MKWACSIMYVYNDPYHWRFFTAVVYNTNIDWLAIRCVTNFMTSRTSARLELTTSPKQVIQRLL